MKRPLSLTLFILSLIAFTAHAQIPERIGYQGTLVDGDGNLLPDGQHELVFRLYESETGGTGVWEEARTIETNRGVFSIQLGEIESLSIPFDRPYWLGISIGGAAELVPRLALAAAPYSLGSRAHFSGLPAGDDFAVLNADGDSVHVLRANGNSWHSGAGIYEGGVNVPQASAGKAGIAQANIGVSAFGTGAGVEGKSVTGDGVRGISDSGVGVLGESTSGPAGRFNGDLEINNQDDGDPGRIFLESIEASAQPAATRALVRDSDGYIREAPVAAEGGGGGGGGDTDWVELVAPRVVYTDNKSIELRVGPDTPFAVSNGAPAATGIRLKATNVGDAIHGTSTLDGFGVRGESNFGNGVEGVSNTGIGVTGQSDANYGVHGITNAPLFAGVGGDGGATGDGVHGIAQAGIGVLGESLQAEGVRGDSPGGTGVLGTSVRAEGVRGESLDGTGVFGESIDGEGVFGESIDGDGVRGESEGMSGVAGKSTTFWGVSGVSEGEVGVYGNTTAAGKAGVYGNGEAASIGVRGKSEDEDGVYGESKGKNGVFGVTEGTTGTGTVQVAGVHGRGGTDAWGVYGTSQGESGVRGFSNASDEEMAGVYGESTNATGVLGTSTSGTAGRFKGEVHIVDGGKSAKLKIDQMEDDPDAPCLVWSDDHYVRMRECWAEEDEHLVSKRGVRISGPSGVVFEVNIDGTSTHTGLETFEAGHIVPLSNGNVARVLPGSGFSVINEGTGEFFFHADIDGNALVDQTLFATDVAASGTVSANTLSASEKNFLIDHPLEPTKKYLKHTSVESPERLNFYSGNVITDGSGYAGVELPAWFEALNEDFRYHLTVVREFAQVMVAEEIHDARFVIRTDRPGVKVSWMISGVRKDAWARANPVDVEPLKTGSEYGRYLHPGAFGMPERMGIRPQQGESHP